MHNLSPIQNGPDLTNGCRKWVHAVCFSLQKRKVFDSAKESRPIKIKKFMVDKKDGSTDLLMSDLVGLEFLTPEAVNFETVADS